jgi:hypothetical protein
MKSQNQQVCAPKLLEIFSWLQAVPSSSPLFEAKYVLPIDFPGCRGICLAGLFQEFSWVFRISSCPGKFSGSSIRHFFPFHEEGTRQFFDNASFSGLNESSRAVRRLSLDKRFFWKISLEKLGMFSLFFDSRKEE